MRIYEKGRRDKDVPTENFTNHIGECASVYEVCEDDKPSLAVNVFWYVADTGYGKLYISLKKGEKEACLDTSKIPLVLQLAVTLGNGEKLIKLVEDWLECGLMLRPVSIMPSSIHTITLTLRGPEEKSDNERIVIGFQDEVLGKLPVLDADHLEKSKIECSRIQTDIVLSDMSIGKEELSLIGKGCIVLIPESYNEYWSIKLITKTKRRMERTGVLDNDGATIKINSQKTSDGKRGYDTDAKDIDMEVKESDVQIATIKTKAPINLPLENILCWDDMNVFVMEKSLRQNDIEISHKGRTIATGHIIKVADGFGIYVS